MLIKLYHWTEQDTAAMIVSAGFQNGGDELNEGVFFSNHPISNMAWNDPCLIELAINSDRDELFSYERIEIGKDFREFVLPVEMVNDRHKCSVRILPQEEVNSIDVAQCWNDYPLGEPMKTINSYWEEELADNS